jgi:hypothetical protein
MNIGETLRESAHGLLAWVTNELRVYARNDDAAKFRVGGPGDHGGCLSFNKVWLDDQNRPINEEELGLIQIKVDERTRNDPNGARAELTIHLNDGQKRQPDSLVPVMLIRTDGWSFLVPNNPTPEHPPDNQGAIPMPTTTSSYDGAQFNGSGNKFLYARQQDGHDVLYRCNTTGAPEAAIWTSDGGPNGSWLGPP